jgi:hypothetical protein
MGLFWRGFINIMFINFNIKKLVSLIIAIQVFSYLRRLFYTLEGKV